MSETSTAAPAESVSPASSAEPSSSLASTSESAPQDTRAIAAQVLRESEGAAAASPAVDPSTPPPTPIAATSDGEDDAVYQNLLASGSMPVDRHKAVLTNARNKARAEVEREFQQRYEWTNGLDRDRVTYGLDILNGLDKNKEHTLRTLAHSLGVDLTPRATEPDGPPQADVKLDDGSEFYSAAQLTKLHAWQTKQYDQKLNALEEKYKPLVAERHLARMKAESAAQATPILAECRSSWPEFSALEGDILARMRANDSLSLEKAYIQAFASKGLPAIESRFQTDRASQLQRKSAASQPPPGQARSVTPQRDRDRSTRDIARDVLQAMS